MKKIRFDGCDTIVIKDNLVVILDIEAECAIITRIDGDKWTGIHFESPIGLKALHKIYNAENELDVLIAALEG
ncbi:hypothetical protein HGO21_29315 [Acinetobacter sp. CUI P1]|nr:hypothetical protein [Acinetobacter sp. CUI P1]